MIRRLPEPLPHPRTQRTPGRYDGLMDFATKIAGVIGPKLHDYAVLDVGGADAWLGEMLAHRIYVCIDQHGPGCDPWNSTMQGEAEALPFKDGSFDLVVSKQTLVHFADPEKAIHEMYRVARQAVIIRQEFPERPIGWLGHSRVQIDEPLDIGLIIVRATLPIRPCSNRYDGTDFISVKVDI